MRPRGTPFRPVKVSLKDLLGRAYVEAVCESRAALTGQRVRTLRRIAGQEVELYPAAVHTRLVRGLTRVGTRVTAGLRTSAGGATSNAFAAASKRAPAPLAAFGYYRVGEDGTLRSITKAEHYHVALGHGFPGYRLVEIARRLGIPNAAHNNQRGHVTRLLEEELVRHAGGIARGDRAALAKALASRRRGVLNRVLNLQSGSVAAEAALKVALARFYRSQADSAQPKHHGKVPVVVVVGDDEGTTGGNYHGTSVFAQLLRGMWPEMMRRLEQGRVMVVRAVRPNNPDDLEAVFARYSRGPYRIACFIHELVMMNYASRLVTKRFIRRAYALCREAGAMAIVDEIQSCLWSPEIFLYREYGIRPDAVVLGKGMTGGEYAASRLLFSAPADVLPQFGALVTNGQEELASLAYLVSLRWAEANAAVTREIGEYYQARMEAMAEEHSDLVRSVDGRRHLMGVCFHDLDSARAFAAALNRRGLDISVQTYKADCPPAALTKLPLTFGYEAVDFVVERMTAALEEVRTIPDCGPLTAEG